MLAGGEKSSKVIEVRNWGDERKQAGNKIPTEKRISMQKPERQVQEEKVREQREALGKLGEQSE